MMHGQKNIKIKDTVYEDVGSKYC